MVLSDLADSTGMGDYVKEKAREGAIAGVESKMPEVKRQVREEAEKAVTPIVKKGVAASVGLSLLLGIVIARARR